MLHLIDKLAGKWLDWRLDRAIRVNPELSDDMQFKRMEVTNGGVELVAMHPAIAYLARDAAQLLDAFSAENYVQFDMMPRLDRGLRPIRVTVQWANGESPANKAARLQEEAARLRAWIIEADAAFNVDNKPAASVDECAGLVRVCYEGAAALAEVARLRAALYTIAHSLDTTPGQPPTLEDAQAIAEDALDK